MTLNVLVCGGTGVFGSLIVETLLSETVDIQITIAARTIAPKFPQLQKITLDLHDLTKFAEIIPHYDVVVIAAGPFQTLSPELAKIAAENKVHYLDLCDDPSYFSKVWQDAHLWEKANRLCLTGLSSLPGISMPLARIASRQFEKIHEIKVGLFIGNANRKGKGAVFSALEGLHTRALTIVEGQRVQKEGWSEKEHFPYPEPIGKVDSFLFSAPDPELMHKAFHATDVSVRVGFEWWAARLTFKVFKGLAARSGVRIIKRCVNTLFPILSALHRFGTERGSVTVIVKGTGKSGPLCMRAAVVGETRGQRLASLPAVIAILALARGDVSALGLQALDVWMAPEVFLAHLQNYGFTFTLEELPCTSS